jgi:hypothetical protein
MADLKPISVDALPRALAKAERYRLLNEPRDAESICRDVLAVDPANQAAMAVLTLALTDQFSAPGEPRPSVDDARAVAERLADPYERVYYTGVVLERWAKANLGGGLPGHVLFDWLAAAMKAFEKADALAPAGNDDAVLRYNACVRLMRRDARLAPKAEQVGDRDMQDDATFV